MDALLSEIQYINNVENATNQLKTQIKFSKSLQNAYDFCIKAHEGQIRISGEPYVVHPILVATLVAYFSRNEDMIIAALLHDVIEDTKYSVEQVENIFGKNVAHLVNGLTKISEIKEQKKLNNADNEKLYNSALSFRKMLLASIDDVGILVIKLCDRAHNMMTLSALSQKKQKRISEDTLVVYAPIAHRLGISSLKNILEDFSFSYLYKDEYTKIDNYLKNNQQKLQLESNSFVSKIESLLSIAGYNGSDIKINSRIKHYYSIYLKMQRKGISIDEILDISALRILVSTPIDCYKVLGLIHTNTKPLISKLKDYIALPKENGYQTIHTTVFYNAKIFEVQIRTFNMNKVAEFGIAAHWKYKDGGNSPIFTQEPFLKWLKSIRSDSAKNVEEFYSDVKEDLFSDEVIVFSPKGDLYTLPRKSVAIDFAYHVHSDVGNKALGCYINNVKKTLLTELNNGDMVLITTSSKPIARCSWINLVKTHRAKKSIKLLCSLKRKQINSLSGENLINTVFKNYKFDFLLKNINFSLHKMPSSYDYFVNIIRKLEKSYRSQLGMMAKLKVSKIKFRQFIFENIVLYSNFKINSVSFDHCCHPKVGDDIVAIGNTRNVFIHHKMCYKAHEKIDNKEKMFFCTWVKNKLSRYTMKISLENVRGSLSKFLAFMFNFGANILFIEYGKDKHSHVHYCAIEFEINNSDKEKVKTKIQKETKIIEFLSS